MAELDTRTIVLQGIELPYVRKGRGPQMLVLHGGAGPVAGAPFMDRLAESFDVVAPIHPGFAGTAIPDRFDDIHDLKFLYLDFIDALELESAVMMGFSMGGWTAAEIAVMTTARFSRLILVDAVGIKTGGRDDREVADVFALPAPDLARITWHDPSRAPDVAAMDDAALTALAGNRVALALYTWTPYMHNPKLAGLLHRIDIPTLVVWGASDGIVTPEYGEAFRARIPGARMVVIPEAGHAPQLERPDAFLDHVLAFAS